MKDNFPTLESERTILRQFVDSDLEDVFKGLSHPDIIKYYGISFDSLEATKEQMQWFSNLEKNQNGIWWAICSKVDGKFLGAGGLNDLNKENKKAEIGFWLLPENWGKGFMTETMPLIFTYAFDKIGLHRIEGFVETENMNCKKALAKLKFSFEGTMKDCEIKNGEFISLDIYSKLDHKELPITKN
ncbi:ribosomal-protein acetyltransferase RimL-like protein [Psychroflexus torquis ATCC 700755]|uniref:Ribosomal-protein acetyltransferase RimL-like protein n=1 Tax=Psychroflexus torquis (strain ATCC 700755 / CIP 106069 / ACAM 623) TaxID=313595 RepID=K4IL84_PSYTT|nr:GNAT family protein [Psychroflexus torquis]AFU70533.1 ribosomal-protein acetyltransferase RimL-like protein [Psychroflexus torquis ATCC 700755]